MRKAAIGPIGDDIPSIFPIVAGVLLFMATAIYASQQLEARNSYLEIRKAGLGLGYVASSSAYLPDDAFNSACDNTYKPFASRSHVNFLVTLKKQCHYVDLVHMDIFSTKSGYPPHALLDDPPHPGAPPGELYYPDPRGSGLPYHHVDLACAGPGIDCSSGQCVEPATRLAPKDFQSFVFPVAIDCAPPDRRPLKGVGFLNVIVWR